MKKIIIAIASVLLISSCLNGEPWRDDYSTISCEFSWPDKKLDKVMFSDGYFYYKDVNYIANECSLHGIIYDNYFGYYRTLFKEGKGSGRLDFSFEIDLVDSIDTETPTLDYKYKITSQGLEIIDRAGNNIEDIEFIDGYVMFTKCEKYLHYIRLSGKFEIICDKLTITNGTFIDILCKDRLGETLESDEDIVNSIRIEYKF